MNLIIIHQKIYILNLKKLLINIMNKINLKNKWNIPKKVYKLKFRSIRINKIIYILPKFNLNFKLNKKFKIA